VQLAYNAEHGITPRSVKTAIKNAIEEEIESHQIAQEAAGVKAEDVVTAEYLEALQQEMLTAAQNLEFERAALLRDKISQLKGEKVATAQVKPKRGGRGKGRGRPTGGGDGPTARPTNLPGRPPRPRADGV
jgi:excinuclease ABC subunit B